jgi:ethanolamine utilization microcompartment shell protein EutL
MSGGRSEVLWSSYVTGNAYAYTAKQDVKGFSEVALTIIANQSQSGVTYTVRGYPSSEGPALAALLAPGYTNTIKADTAMVSGDIHYLVFSNPYDKIDVGGKNTASNYSGRVTVIATMKRRG